MDNKQNNLNDNLNKNVNSGFDSNIYSDRSDNYNNNISNISSNYTNPGSNDNYNNTGSGNYTNLGSSNNYNNISSNYNNNNYNASNTNYNNSGNKNYYNLYGNIGNNNFVQQNQRPADSKLALKYALSVVEIIFGFLCGVIAIVFTCQADKAFSRGDMVTYNKKKKAINITLIIGIIYGLAFIGYMASQFTPGMFNGTTGYRAFNISGSSNSKNRTSGKFAASEGEYKLTIFAEDLSFSFEKDDSILEQIYYLNKDNGDWKYYDENNTQIEIGESKVGAGDSVMINIKDSDGNVVMNVLISNNTLETKKLTECSCEGMNLYPNHIDNFQLFDYDNKIALGENATYSDYINSLGHGDSDKTVGDKTVLWGYYDLSIKVEFSSEEPSVISIYK